MMAADTDLVDRLAKLERRLRIAVVVAVAGSFFGVCGTSALFVAPASAGQAARTIDVLRVRELDVVDRNGTTRVKLAAPLPAPIIDGQPRKTRGGSPDGTMSGMLLFDAEGVERSGYATVDKGYSNVLLTLDDKRQQHALFIAEPNGATTLRLFNGATKDRVDVAIDEGGPSISMMRRGQEIYRVPTR